jgi:hypothetical protein
VSEPWDEVIRRAIEKTRHAELHWKLDEILATTPLGRDYQSEHFQAIKYVINSAHNATASKRQDGVRKKADRAIGPWDEVLRRIKAKEEVPQWEIGRAQAEQLIFDDKERRAELHRKLDEVLAASHGRDRQCLHFQTIKYIIDSAHEATASKRQSAWFKEKTKSS